MNAITFTFPSAKPRPSTKMASKNEDKGVVLAAVKQNGFVLRYASAELKADKEVVIAAVSQNGEALMYASAELKADKEVVLAAVSHGGCALEPAVVESILALVTLEVRADFEAFVRTRHVAHATFITFLIAARPSGGASRPPPATRPAPLKLEDLGEDAGRHVRRLIADFAGVPCGKAWVDTCIVADNATTSLPAKRIS